MSTVSSIGSGAGRTYSTPAAWLAAFANGGWEGECYNDSEFSSTSAITINQATSSANFIKLRSAAGQGFKDNANAQTNALKYNAANGAAIKCTGYATTVLACSVDWFTLSNLQFSKQGGNNGNAVLLSGNNSNRTVEGCIAEVQLGVSAVYSVDGASLIRNCLAVHRVSSNGDGFDSPSGNGATFVNCTSIKPSDKTAGGSAFSVNYNTSTIIKNCAGFGFTNFFNGTHFSASCSNNCSDKTISIGTSNQASKTYANQFVGTADASQDFRVKNSSADLYNNGTTDTTDIPAANDIVGTSRPQSSAWDIGCWELVVAAASVVGKFLGINQSVNRAGTY